MFPGTTNPNGQSSCSCRSGYYVDTNASTNQTACSPGTYQSVIGQSSCNPADTGYYVDTNASTNQTACSPGTYQSVIGQSSCNPADTGYYVPTLHQTMSGTYNRMATL